MLNLKKSLNKLEYQNILKIHNFFLVYWYQYDRKKTALWQEGLQKSVARLGEHVNTHV